MLTDGAVHFTTLFAFKVYLNKSEGTILYELQFLPRSKPLPPCYKNVFIKISHLFSETHTTRLLAHNTQSFRMLNQVVNIAHTLL
jgi:hypothetical protein